MSVNKKIISASILSISLSSLLNSSYAYAAQVDYKDNSFENTYDDNSTNDIDIDKEISEIEKLLDFNRNLESVNEYDDSSQEINLNENNSNDDSTELKEELENKFDTNEFDELNLENENYLSKSSISNSTNAPYLKGEYMYISDKNGKENLIKNQWTNLSDKKYYVGNDGKVFLGKHLFENSKSKFNYYFTLEDGLTKNKLIIADGGKYLASYDGKLILVEKAKQGWASLEDKRYYFDDKSNMKRGLIDLGETRHYFDRVFGHLIKNQIIDESNRIITTDKNGIAKRVGFDYYNGIYSYNNKDGSFRKGLNNISGKNYFFDKNGNMKRNSYQKVSNQWYYFDKYGEGKKSNGNFKKGWHGKYYYLEDGKKAYGYQYINGYLHYFDDRTGQLEKNTYGVYKNKQYYFDKNGVGRLVKKLSNNVSKAGTNGNFRPGFTRNDLGRKTPYFSQNDIRWKRTPYGKSYDNYGNVGCGPTALAMAINRELGRNDIYPTNVGKDLYYYSAVGGTEWTAMSEYPERYGLKSYDVPITKDALIQALEDHPVIIRVGNGYFINGGLFLVVDSYKDGKFYINDPYFTKRNTEGYHPFERLRQEVTLAWQIK